MKKQLFVFIAACGLFIGAGQAHSETYIQGYGGWAMPHESDMSSRTGEEGKIEFDPGPAAGVKWGSWFDSAPYFGLQLDLNGHLPELDTLTNSSGATATADADMQAYSASINAVLRLPSGAIKPYIGAGAGWHFANIDDGTLTASVLGVPTAFEGDDDDGFGWNVLAGVDFEVTSSFSIFAEYKYTQADFEFDTLGLDIDYEVSQAYAGLSYSF